MTNLEALEARRTQRGQPVSGTTHLTPVRHLRVMTVEPDPETRITALLTLAQAHPELADGLIELAVLIDPELAAKVAKRGVKL